MTRSRPMIQKQLRLTATILELIRILAPERFYETAQRVGFERSVRAISGVSSGTPSPGSPPMISIPLTTGAWSGSSPDRTLPPVTVSPRSGHTRRKCSSSRPVPRGHRSPMTGGRRDWQSPRRPARRWWPRPGCRHAARHSGPRCRHAHHHPTAPYRPARIAAAPLRGRGSGVGQEKPRTGSSIACAHQTRHPGEGRDPRLCNIRRRKRSGMTGARSVIPEPAEEWIPAFAGMTAGVGAANERTHPISIA